MFKLKLLVGIFTLFICSGLMHAMEQTLHNPSTLKNRCLEYIQQNNGTNDIVQNDLIAILSDPNIIETYKTELISRLQLELVKRYETNLVELIETEQLSMTNQLALITLLSNAEAMGLNTYILDATQPDKMRTRIIRAVSPSWIEINQTELYDLFNRSGTSHATRCALVERVPVLQTEAIITTLSCQGILTSTLVSIWSIKTIEQLSLI